MKRIIKYFAEFNFHEKIAYFGAVLLLIGCIIPNTRTFNTYFSLVMTGSGPWMIFMILTCVLLFLKVFKFNKIVLVLSLIILILVGVSIFDFSKKTSLFFGYSNLTVMPVTLILGSSMLLMGNLLTYLDFN